MHSIVGVQKEKEEVPLTHGDSEPARHDSLSGGRRYKVQEVGGQVSQQGKPQKEHESKQ